MNYKIGSKMTRVQFRDRVNSVNVKYKVIKNKIVIQLYIDILIDLDAIFPKCIKNISYRLNILAQISHLRNYTGSPYSRKILYIGLFDRIF